MEIRIFKILTLIFYIFFLLILDLYMYISVFYSAFVS